MSMSIGVFLKAAMPNWLLKLGLSKRVRDVPVAFKELKVCWSCVHRSVVCLTEAFGQIYMQEMIQERRSSEIAGEKHDLLSSLVDASQSEMGEEPALSDDELMGNIRRYILP